MRERDWIFLYLGLIIGMALMFIGAVWVEHSHAGDWDNYEDNPVLTDISQHIRDPSEIAYIDGAYYVYFNILPSAASSSFDVEYADVGCSTAPEITGPWSTPSIVIHNGNGDDDLNPGDTGNLCEGSAEWDCVGLVAPTITRDGDTLYLFYNGILDLTTRDKSLGVATLDISGAADPCDPFTKSANNPIFEPADSNTTTDIIASQYILKMKDGWRMYYKTRNTPTQDDRRFNVATTTDALFPEGWTNYASNPVIQQNTDGLPVYTAGFDDIAVIPINGEYYLMLQTADVSTDVEWYKSTNGLDTWTSADATFSDWLDSDCTGTWCEDESIGFASGSLHGKTFYMNNGGNLSSTKMSMGLFIQPFGVIDQGGSSTITLGGSGELNL